MSNSEADRVEAERLRRLAEAERAYAESHEGDGRVQAEQKRAEAEEKRESNHEEFHRELELLRQDPDHYMTPATHLAFKNYRKGAIKAFAILSIGFIIGIWGVNEKSKNDLRTEINEFATTSCLASRAPNSPINKYNDLIEHQIQSIREAREINKSRGEMKRVAANTRSITRLQGDKIDIPTVLECNSPILK